MGMFASHSLSSSQKATVKENDNSNYSVNIVTENNKEPIILAQLSTKHSKQRDVIFKPTKKNLSLKEILATPSSITSKKLKSTKVIKVRKGDTLSDIFTRAGLNTKQRFLAIKELTKIYNPKYLKIGQELLVYFENKKFKSLAIDGKEDIITLTNTRHNIYKSHKKLKMLTKKTVRAAGTIDNSLYLLASQLKIPANIMSKAVNAYSYDVDFQRDIKKGNKFEILYEKYIDREGNKVKDGNLVYASLAIDGEDMKIYLFSPSGKTIDEDYYTANGRTLRRSLLKTPINGAIISSPFGKRRHPISGYTKLHKGVDFAAKRGTPFYAGGDGKIVQIGRNGGYGNYIKIRHNSEYSTAYAHIYKFAKNMQKGKRVKQGQVIAYVGSTGASTGPHLHYEIHRNGKQINPMRSSIPRGKRLTGKKKKLFIKRKSYIDKLLNDRAKSAN